MSWLKIVIEIKVIQHLVKLQINVKNMKNYGGCCAILQLRDNLYYTQYFSCKSQFKMMIYISMTIKTT